MTTLSARGPVAIVGASFGGLACAEALADRGVEVVVIDRKAEPGEKPHTTGILVRDLVDDFDWLGALPPEIARAVPGVRLYAPNMRSVDLEAPGYYFLATDTPALMRRLAERCAAAGVRFRYGAPFLDAAPTPFGWRLDCGIDVAYLVGADGPKSQVARHLGLGENRRFLYGLEHEYIGDLSADADRLHCFVDKRLAPGYIAWMLAGVGVVQIGLARRYGEDAAAATKQGMAVLLDKIAPIADFRGATPCGLRAGLIPCGGLVAPLSRPRALLVGDAAGMVSPVTAGGIHRAMRHGREAGAAIAAFLQGRAEDPALWLPRSYPRFHLKRALRFLFDRFQSDLAFDLLLNSPLMRAAASEVFFRQMRAR